MSPALRTLRLATDRLDLVAGTLALAEAELRDAAEFAAALGCAVPPSWPPGEYDRTAIEYLRDRMREGGDVCAGWYSWYAIERDAEPAPTLVAAGGYFGPPADGEVEIGYSVIPEAQRRGIATEMARALVARAFDEPLVRSVRAHTYDSNPVSIRVLERCGFRRVGPGESPESVRFRLARPQGARTS